MKIKDVPQDYGMGEDQREICYAVDEKGNYVLAPSLGWEPKNIANAQAWQVIEAQVADALDRIRTGRASPLAYYMARHQMSVGLLAKYVGLFRWRVRRHLKPSGFKALTPDMLRRYADLFEITVRELTQIPSDTGETGIYDQKR
jgi:hypothetical protein